MLLRTGRETPARPVHLPSVRRVRSSNRGDPLPARVRSCARVGPGAAVDQARPGCQGPLTRVYRIPTALRQRDGISGAAPSPDTRRSGVTLYARSSLAIRQSRLNSREWSMSHQRRLSSPPASALPEIYAEAITTSSSAPSRAGEWDSHQRTSRISSLGSASGSQPGQYAGHTGGVRKVIRHRSSAHVTAPPVPKMPGECLRFPVL